LDHGARVDAWLEEAGRGLSAAALCVLFQAALEALYRRTQVTLGDVTLRAIVERVVHRSAITHPAFGSLRIDENGAELGALRDRVGSLKPAELTAGIRFVLVELLTVLGNLTGDILTPELHATLAAVVPPKVTLAARGGGREG
jgi:hypothetical protein